MAKMPSRHHTEGFYRQHFRLPCAETRSPSDPLELMLDLWIPRDIEPTQPKRPLWRADLVIE
jgi:hypothetical protein